MILLLIVAVAAIALVVMFSLKMTRTRSRQRQERLAKERRAAAAAEARSRAQRRRGWDDADDALTSVIPAIKLPWPTQLPGTAGNGYPDLDGEYPGFSALTPFDAAPYNPPVFDPGPPEPEYFDEEPEFFDQAPPDPAAAGPEFADREPFEPVVPGQRPEEFRLPRRGAGQYPAQAGSPEDYMIPVPRSDEAVPAAFPGEHGTAADRARKRASAHGNHRGGHAKRRRT
jgi:type II secretory pathway pseudopilin PulG